MHGAVVPWLKQREISLLRSDSVNDLQPSGVIGQGEAANRPIHTLMIAVLGVGYTTLFSCFCRTGIVPKSLQRSFGITCSPPSIRSGISRRGFSLHSVFGRALELESALRTQHLTQDAEPVASTPHGQKFTVRVILSGPAGQSAVVVSVWFVRANDTVPRFVTAYPGGGR